MSPHPLAVQECAEKTSHSLVSPEENALLQMCQHLEQLTRTIDMTVSPMLQTATASKVSCGCIAWTGTSTYSCCALAASRWLIRV